MDNEGVRYSALIVDDHRISREGLHAILKFLPCVGEVGQATNGRDAVERLKHHPYDFVFMDIKMPVMDGLEATKIIVREYPFVHVIALSVYDEERHVNGMFDAGAKGYLLKNTEPEEIQEAIRAIVSGKVYYAKAVSDALLQNIRARKSLTSEVAFSQREKQILHFLWQGLSSKEMASRLFVSIKTVNLDRGKLLAKTKSHNAVELVKFALQHGIIDEMEGNIPKR